MLAFCPSAIVWSGNDVLRSPLRRIADASGPDWSLSVPAYRDAAVWMLVEIQLSC